MTKVRLVSGTPQEHLAQVNEAGRKRWQPMLDKWGGRWIVIGSARECGRGCGSDVEWPIEGPAEMLDDLAAYREPAIFYVCRHQIEAGD